MCVCKEHGDGTHITIEEVLCTVEPVNSARFKED